VTRMDYEFDAAAAERLADFFHRRVGRHLRRREQRESFATYAFGILSDGERKSVEPIAARAVPDPEETPRAHDRLLHFTRESPWPDRPIRREAARYALEVLSEREPITTWIIDDTGFLKQGRHSPGVHRQWTGSAGKVTNCQIGVSLSIATRAEQMPIDMALYLPECWTEDQARRRQARIPEEIVHKTKTELALDMILAARHDGIPGDVLLADSGYGDSAEFRNRVRALGFDYAVGVRPNATVWVLDAADRRRGDPVRLRPLATLRLPDSAFRKYTWREGTKGKMSGRFAFVRVKSAGKTEEAEPGDREPLWLVVEQCEDADRSYKFYFTTLRRRMSKKEIVRIIKERWKTERVYEEMKGELGLDHFEGRSFTGWQHHVTVVLCCYAFIVAERASAFFPSGGEKADDSDSVAA